MSFTDLQKDVVKDFLHSAVLIDDNIQWSLTENNTDIATEVKLIEPDDLDGSLHPEEMEAAAPNSSPLHAKPIIKSFSDHGIVCSPYIWENEDTVFPGASEKADLLILDWKLEPDATEEKGTYAKSFIKQRLEQDIKNRERLRFISIYTSEPSNHVLPTLKKDLDDILGISICEENNDCLDIVSASGHKTCRITVISKNTTTETELADKLIEDFTSFVQGFLPNVLLSSIAEIRSKTYEYLAQYHSGLDCAVLGHYSALKSQKKTFDTAEEQFREYVSNLIGSNFQNSLIFSERGKEAISKEVILKYLDSQDSLILSSKKNKSTNKTEILKILKCTSYEDLKDKTKLALVFKDDTEKQKERWEKFKMGQQPLFLTDQDHEVNLELSVLDLFKRTHPPQPKNPPLRLGTIVKEKTRDVYYLCVQPLCDGVRLHHEGDHSFPFLKLSEVTNGVFNFVIPFNGKLKKFKCETKPKNIISFKFRAHKGKGDIRSRKYGHNEHYLFHNHTGKQGFIWVGELKDIYAQETLNLLAHQGSRVGSDKLEWLRTQG